VEVGQSLTSRAATEALDRAMSGQGQLEAITLDKGTESNCNHFDRWAYQRGIQLDFITPGRPVGYNVIESFSGKLRDECLSVHWFESLVEARAEIETWQREYNETRRHSSLGNRAPVQYIAELLSVGVGT